MWIQIEGNIQVYSPTYFRTVELFPPEMIREELNEFLWVYMNPLVTITMDRLREKYGTAIVNTWGLGKTVQDRWGVHRWRGWRPKDCSIGATLSQHKMGCAVDMVFASVDAETVRGDLLAGPFDRPFEYITAIEMGVDWFHFDVRPHDKVNKGVFEIHP